MGAASANRPAPRMGEHVDPIILSIPVKDNVHIYGGTMVALDSSGYALPAAASTAVFIVGIADAEADNTVTGHTAGGIKVRVRQGTFKMVNDSAGTPLTSTSVGGACYAMDDQTVSGSTGGSTRAIAGTVVQVDSTTECWVKMNLDFRGVTDATLRTNLASNANGDGAALVALEDALAAYTATTVEGALQSFFDKVVTVTPAEVNGANLAAGKVLLATVANKQIFLDGAIIEVNGATAWDTLASLTISDDNTAVTNCAVVNVAALAGNGVVAAGMPEFLPKKGMARGTVVNTNLVIRANANSNGNGSTLNCHIWGRIA